jgi:hypothetical protein
MKSTLLGGTVTMALLTAATATATASGPAISYVPNSLAESVVNHGPWTLHESTGSFQHDASGIVPPPSQTAPPYTGTGTPYASYCTANGTLSKNHGASVMQPYYFPFVRRRGAILEGFFDYRPRNEEEAVVSAISSDWGATWIETGEALALNPYCPWDATDPDNLNVNVSGVKTPYGSSNANAADNGLGHPVVLYINGTQRIYQLNRANGFIDSSQLVVHTLPPGAAGSLAPLPNFGYVSPLAPGGYPTLESTAQLTSGLTTPDAIMGAVNFGSTTAVVYVAKALNADTGLGYPACPKTPAFALTNIDNNGAQKGPNHDVTTVRVATTTDGISFTDVPVDVGNGVGVATGLNDPKTVAFNGIRYLGSGSIIRLTNGHYGMFFGAGNCLDNDSDGFHFTGYAETVNAVNQVSDLLKWTVIYGLDNPILSTDTVTDPTGPRPYPLNPPLVNVSRFDALTAKQVFPFVPPQPSSPLVIPPWGYNSNFFSGRVYDPQVVYTDEQTVTIIFAGYNTPQPKNNLGDYRTIGRFQLRFPAGYIALPN